MDAAMLQCGITWNWTNCDEPRRYVVDCCFRDSVNLSVIPARAGMTEVKSCLGLVLRRGALRFLVRVIAR